EIRHVAFLRQPVDQINITRVPLPPDRAIGHSVPGLNHEPDWEGSLLEFFNCGDRGVDDHRMLVLKLETIATSARVAVNNEGKPIDAGRIFFARQRRARRFDRADRLIYCLRGQRRLLLNSRLLRLRLSRRLGLRILSNCERECAEQRMGRRKKWFEHSLSYWLFGVVDSRDCSRGLSSDCRRFFKTSSWEPYSLRSFQLSVLIYSRQIIKR